MRRYRRALVEVCPLVNNDTLAQQIWGVHGLDTCVQAGPFCSLDELFPCVCPEACNQALLLDDALCDCFHTGWDHSSSLGELCWTHYGRLPQAKETCEALWYEAPTSVDVSTWSANQVRSRTHVLHSLWPRSFIKIVMLRVLFLQNEETPLTGGALRSRVLRLCSLPGAQFCAGSR